MVALENIVTSSSLLVEDATRIWEGSILDVDVDNSGLEMSDVEYHEINEAFSVVVSTM